MSATYLRISPVKKVLKNKEFWEEIPLLKLNTGKPEISRTNRGGK